MVRNSGAKPMVVLDFFKVTFWVFQKFGICLYRTSSEKGAPASEAIAFASSMAQIGCYSILVPLFFIKTTPTTAAEFSDALTPLILFLTSIVRIMSILVNIKRIRTLVGVLEKYFPQNMEEQKKFEGEINHKKLIRVTKALSICISLACILFTLGPLFHFAVAYYSIGDEAKFDYGMPYPIWYPFKVNTPGIQVDVTNDIFNISVFISFFSSIAQLCSIGMNVLTESQPYHLVKQNFLLGSSLCDLYYVCKYADDMKTSVITPTLFTILK
uniref:Odorant receptor n=1 Tax=Glossina austeni TaxID=7395 RepID=A0A1A9VI71_GLOAU